MIGMTCVMDEGRIAGTTDIWDATQIAQAVDVERTAWECPGCTLPLVPAAWRPGGKVTAHFRGKPPFEHAEGCLYERISNAKHGSLRLGGGMGRPRSWIDAITFPAATRRPTVISVLPRRAPAVIAHSSTRTSIGGASRYHYAMQRSAWKAELRVQGVVGRTYFDVFAPVTKVQSADDRRIWFASLRRDQKPGDWFRDGVALNVGGADGWIRVVPDASRWSDFQKAVFGNRIEVALEWMRASKGGSRDAIAYVLATRLAERPGVLAFSDPRMFALVRG